MKGHAEYCIKWDFCRESTEIMLELYRKLQSGGFNEMKYLNLGGGLSVPYRQHVNMEYFEYYRPHFSANDVTKFKMFAMTSPLSPWRPFWIS